MMRNLLLSAAALSLSVSMASAEVNFDSGSNSGLKEQIITEIPLPVPARDGRILPVLHHVLAEAKAAGVTEAAVVVSEDSVVAASEVVALAVLAVVAAALVVTAFEEVVVASVLVALVPDLSTFNIADELQAGVAIPPAYFLHATLYGLSWVGFFVVLSLLVFERRDLV